jgi:N-formylglutamate amidohydrolase
MKKAEVKIYNNIILHIPHASVAGLGYAKWDDEVGLIREVKRWTDWYTDLIFVPVNRPEVKSITADYSRFVVDLKSMLNEHSLLIDCHSFPSDLSEFDICIGFNDDWSRPSDFIIDLVVEFFKKKGYKVSINSPYSNAIAPETNFVYNSIMIEINKKVYLNEQSLELTDNANILREQLSKLYRILLRYNEEFVIKDHGKKQL